MKEQTRAEIEIGWRMEMGSTRKPGLPLTVLRDWRQWKMEKSGKKP